MPAPSSSRSSPRIRLALLILTLTIPCAAAPAIAQCRTWATFPTPPLSTLNAVHASTQFGSRYIAAGSFAVPAAGGATAHNILGWDGIDITAFGTGTNAPVRALLAYSTIISSNLVAGGEFTLAGGVTANRIAIWSTSNILPIDPAWSPLGPGFNGTVNAIARFNNVIYAAGSFTMSGTTAVSRIARYNGSTNAWEPLGSGLNGTANALEVHGGALYVGGSFTSAGGLNTGAIARWNGTSWSVVGSGPFGGVVNALESFIITPGSSEYLMVGGSWTGASPNLAAWAGDIFVNLVASGGTNGPIYTFYADNDADRLYAGGAFTIITGRGCGNTAVLNPFQGGGWDPLLGGTDTDVRTMQLFHGEIVTGGLFNTAGGINRPRLARFILNGAPWIARQSFSQTVCPAGTTLTAQVAAGYDNVTYQWRRGGTTLTNGPTGTGSSLSGATTNALTITSAGNADEGDYVGIAIISGCGSAGTSPITLTVCAGDRDCNQVTQPADVSLYVFQWFNSLQNNDTLADFDGNAVIEPADVSGFVAAWFDELTNGC